jgi:hypothetical protein
MKPGATVSSEPVSSEPVSSEHGRAPRERLILAVILPDLLNELAAQRAIESMFPVQPRGFQPLAVILTDPGMPILDDKTQLDAVNSAAHKLGVCPRQTIAQATAIVGNLSLHSLPRACVSAALKQVAEVALGFGSPVSFQAPDTVWVDVTGSSHLFCGKRELALELVAHIQALGHRAQVALASGPWLAQSFARHSARDSIYDAGPAGVFIADTAHTLRDVGNLPIMALPIDREAVTWFSRLGLLNIDDLRKLPQSALAARLDRRDIRERASSCEISAVLDLIQGHDTGVLIPYYPEEMPCEESYWDEPLESIEPLLFVLKGLSGRLSARLEGRGQAAQALLLSIHYDRSIAALRKVSASLALNTGGVNTGGVNTGGVNTGGVNTGGVNTVNDRDPSESVQPIEKLPFRLASPLVHAEDFERIVRSRLQRLTLLAPAIGLSLQATSVTEARHWQLGLQADVGLGSALASDPRAMAVLVAELAADIGDTAVGVLVAHDSHLMEKNSDLVPIQKALLREVPCRQETTALPQAGDVFLGSESRASASQAFLDNAFLGNAKGVEIGMAGQGTRLEPLLEGRAVFEGRVVFEGRPLFEGRPGSRLPTRLLASPIELRAPIRKNELWVLQERAYVVESIQFDQRLEAVEWWDSVRIFRDYFRIWLAAVEGRQMARNYPENYPEKHYLGKHCPDRQGLEALVYLDREDGKSYIQALYD